MAEKVNGGSGSITLPIKAIIELEKEAVAGTEEEKEWMMYLYCMAIGKAFADSKEINISEDLEQRVMNEYLQAKDSLKKIKEKLNKFKEWEEKNND